MYLVVRGLMICNGFGVCDCSHRCCAKCQRCIDGLFNNSFV